MKNIAKQFLFGTTLTQNKATNIIWLLFRLHIGLTIAFKAGLPKMQDGLAPEWFVKQVSEIGFTFISPTFWATVASWGEFVGGLCIALGLLTRFNAIQLAFQFFVIAFIWFDKPEPVTGMYFQNTLFMSYLLTAFIGGGKYSLDNLIVNYKNIVVTKNAKPAFATIILIMLSTVMVAQKPLKGSGVVVNKEYSYNNFTTVNINDIADAKVTINLGNAYKILAKVDDNFTEDFSITLNEQTLNIKLNNNRNNKQYIEDTKIEIEIEMPNLENFYHNSNSNVLINNINNNQLSIKNTGNGNLTLNGKTGNLNIICTSNGNVNAKNLIATKAEAVARGNGNIYLNSPNLNIVNRSGNGNIINDFKTKTTNKTTDSLHTTVLLKVKVTIVNNTNKLVRYKVQYYVSGSYGISVKPNSSYSEFFPPKTKLYIGNSIDDHSKLKYTVTEAAEQTFTID
jgi:uncharacterized membrane protein YphA (DoxX/SURF4 family)